jgi:glutaredoxin-like protein
MIPLREQDYIRQLFAEQLTGPVKIEFFTQRPAPVYVPGREECQFCPDVQALLEDLARLSAKVSVRVHELSAAGDVAARYGVTRVPATVIRGTLNRPVVYYGLPAANQFTVLVELMVAVSRGETGVPAATKRRLKRIKRDLPVEVYVTMDDPASPDAVRVAARLALDTNHIKLSVIEIAEFSKLAESLGIQNVPLTVIDGRMRLGGVPPEPALLDQLVKVGESSAVTTGTRLPGGGVALDLPRAADVQAGETRPSGLIIPRR